MVLSGPPGSGRTAAARMLAFRSWSGEGTLHELVPQEPDDDYHFTSTPVSSAVVTACGWTSRPPNPLSGDTSNGNSPCCTTGFKRMKRASSSYSRTCRTSQPTSAATISSASNRGSSAGVRPSPAGGKAGARRADTGHDVPEKSQDHGRHPPVRARHPGSQSSGRGHRRTRGLDQGCRTAGLPAESRVSEAFDKVPSAADRALLLSVAMLHGSHADIIESAATMLLARIPDDSDAASPSLRLEIDSAG